MVGRQDALACPPSSQVLFVLSVGTLRRHNTSVPLYLQESRTRRPRRALVLLLVVGLVGCLAWCLLAHSSASVGRSGLFQPSQNGAKPHNDVTFRIQTKVTSSLVELNKGKDSF